MAVDDVREILFDFAPELESTDEVVLARVDRFIGYAADELLPDVWAEAETEAEVTADSWYNRANALLAAHMLTLRAAGANAPVGPVVSEKIGDVSTTYAHSSAGAQSPSTYDATSYGRQYQEFRRSCFPPVSAIGGLGMGGITDPEDVEVEEDEEE